MGTSSLAVAGSFGFVLLRSNNGLDGLNTHICSVIECDVDVKCVRKATISNTDIDTCLCSWPNSKQCLVGTTGE